MSGLCCLEVEALSSSHRHHIHIPSRPLLLPPLHTCVYARTRGHIHTHKPTHALATTSAAPSQWLGELNLPGTHAFSPIPAKVRHGGGDRNKHRLEPRSNGHSLWPAAAPHISPRSPLPLSGVLPGPFSAPPCNSLNPQGGPVSLLRTEWGEGAKAETIDHMTYCPRNFPHLCSNPPTATLPLLPLVRRDGQMPSELGCLPCEKARHCGRAGGGQLPKAIYSYRCVLA